MSYFYTFKDYLFKKFDKKVWRISLATGYPCPNRINGKKGCTFCDGVSFLPEYVTQNKDLKTQMEMGMDKIGRLYKADLFYGYFQFNTSTYGDTDKLLDKYKTVLSHDKTAGLIISTRPDYIDEEIIKKINKLNMKFKKDIWIELGLQTLYDETLVRINRNHTYSDFQKAVKIIKDNSKIKITVHMIIGLPGESEEMIVNGMKKLFKENNIDGIKFRLLEIQENTPIYNDYLKNRDDFIIFDFESYSKILSDILEIIPENVIVMRLINQNSLREFSKGLKKGFSKNKLIDEMTGIFKKRKSKQGIKL